MQESPAATMAKLRGNFARTDKPLQEGHIAVKRPALRNLGWRVGV